LKKETCRIEVIADVFSPFGKIENFKLMMQNNFKNMCLLKYSTVEEAINAVAHLHEKEICGRGIKISFTRSKI